MYLDSKTLSSPVYIQDDKDGSGSGFFMVRNQKLYLVTARHVLYDAQGFLLTDILLITSYNYSKPKYRTNLKLDLKELTVHSKHVKDVAAVEVAKIVDHEDKQSFSIFYLEGVSLVGSGNVADEGDANIFVTPESTYKKLDEVVVSSDVFILGFPSSLGNKSDQISRDMPLLRKGAVAGINWTNHTIILDCPAYYGNSGGMAISIQDGNYAVIGVVSRFIPFVEHMRSRENDYVNQNIENSGYSVVIPMDAIFDLL